MSRGGVIKALRFSNTTPCPGPPLRASGSMMKNSPGFGWFSVVSNMRYSLSILALSLVKKSLPALALARHGQVQRSQKLRKV
ncbi:hypothetical protein XFF6960_640003 [Xanthomonas citri pv. fuscans]|nr:hypothetical protein XFF6960_640003 [Xanthomonas citri pv. fuscans]